MSLAQGKRYDMARDTSVKALPTGMVTAGLAKDTSVTGVTATLQGGVAPGAANSQVLEQILQPPGAYTLFTFTANGRIWGASVSYAMGSTAGTGANPGYARVHVLGGKSLAIVECVVVANPDADSNDDSHDWPGLPVLSGAVVSLDVNAGATITGVSQRASGLVAVSIP